MGKPKNLSGSDRGNIVMARRLGQSISKLELLWDVDGLQFRTYQKLSKEGERRLAHVVWSNRRATVAQIAEKVIAGCDRNVSDDNVGQGAHADPCPLPKALEMSTLVSELDHKAMEEGGLV